MSQSSRLNAIELPCIFSELVDNYHNTISLNVCRTAASQTWRHADNNSPIHKVKKTRINTNSDDDSISSSRAREETIIRNESHLSVEPEGTKKLFDENQSDQDNSEYVTYLSEKVTALKVFSKVVQFGNTDSDR
ncbi:14038_t:CDS:2, partial [Cetraspora pellucida]